MARSYLLQILVTFLLVEFTFAGSSPGSSPSPAPVSPEADSLSSNAPAPHSRSPLHAPAGSPSSFSPPAPSLMVPSPAPSLMVRSPAPSNSAPESSTVPVPSPGPSEVSDMNHSNVEGIRPDLDERSSGGGMSGGKKAGIVVGVAVAACLVGLGGFVYKKRQENISRSQYSYAARRELL